MIFGRDRVPIRAVVLAAIARSISARYLISGLARAGAVEIDRKIYLRKRTMHHYAKRRKIPSGIMSG